MNKTLETSSLVVMRWSVCGKNALTMDTSFYRIPNGESAADAYDRVSGFNESLWRQFGENDFASVLVLGMSPILAACEGHRVLALSLTRVRLKSSY